MKSVLYEDQPCERCGSKKRVSRTWKENIPVFGGTTEVKYSQVICTNPACQRAFEEKLRKEAEKREVLRLQKEEKDKIRKANSLLQVNRSRKGT